MIICLLAIVIIMIVNSFILKIKDDGGHGDFLMLIHGDSGLHRVASIGLLLHQEALQIRLLLLQRGHHLTSGSTVFMFNIFQLPHPVATCNLRPGSYIY